MSQPMSRVADARALVPQEPFEPRVILTPPARHRVARHVAQQRRLVLEPRELALHPLRLRLRAEVFEVAGRGARERVPLPEPHRSPRAHQRPRRPRSERRDLPPTPEALFFWALRQSEGETPSNGPPSQRRSMGKMSSTSTHQLLLVVARLFQ